MINTQSFALLLVGHWLGAMAANSAGELPRLEQVTWT
jgi:hypothetical protein